MDERLRKLQRDALSTQDPLTAYNAALYAFQSGELACIGQHHGFQVTIQTPNGPLDVNPTFSYHGQRWNAVPAFYQHLNVRSQDYFGYSFHQPTGAPYVVNGRNIRLEVDYSFPELRFNEPEARRVSAATPISPARRLAIAQLVRDQIAPWAHAEGVAHVRAAAQDYMRCQIWRNLESVKGAEKQLREMQIQAGQLYLQYLAFKQANGDLTPSEQETIDSAATAEDGYTALCALLASGQLGLEHNTFKTREALIQTPYGPIHAQRLPNNHILVRTLGTQYQEPWQPLKMKVKVGAKEKEKEVYVAFNFELSRYGYPVADKYARTAQRSELIFGRDNMREVSALGGGGGWRKNSKNLDPKIRKQLISMIEKLVSDWAAGAQDTIKKADYDIFLHKLKQAEKNILDRVSSINEWQQEAGRAYLFLYTL